MRYRKLTGDMDYSFGHGQNDFWKDVPEAVGQSVETRLLLWIGEWFLDLTDGTPWLQGVLGKQTLLSADNTVKQRILATTGVVDIKNYQSSIDPITRLYTASCTIDTIYGPTQIQVQSNTDL